MSTNDFLEPLIAAVEASASVVLTLLYGFLAGRACLFDDQSVRQINKVVAHIFLPLLIITKVGPEMTWSNLKELWIILLWSICTIGGSFLWGYAAHRLLKMPAWISPACGLVNANAFPLLMLQSLETSGLLKRLIWHGETVNSALNRGQSYILLNSVIQQSIAFLYAPRILEEDRGHEDGEGDLLGSQGHRDLADIEQDAEHVGLLRDYDGQDPPPAKKPMTDLDNHLDKNPIVAKPGWLLEAISLVSGSIGRLQPPVIGVIFALLFGIIPPLRHVIFEGPLTASILQSWQNLGELYVSLQMFILGVLLHQEHVKHHTSPGLWPSLFVLTTRFVLMPAISLIFILFTGGRNYYRDDPVLYLVLVLIASGPTALILSSLAQLSEVDVAPVTGFLGISYLISPLLSVTVSLAFRIISTLQQASSNSSF